jgi:hypothetical protein
VPAARVILGASSAIMWGSGIPPPLGTLRDDDLSGAERATRLVQYTTTRGDVMSGKRRGRIGAAKIAANLAKRVERGARKASAKAARAAEKQDASRAGA